MVLAVLDTRCGLNFAGRDVYLNVAGGLRISEPAADLAVAAALVSAAADEPVPPDTVVFGEIGLAGEIRTVSQTALRLGEAQRLGFTAAWSPPEQGARGEATELRITTMAYIQDLVRTLGPARGAWGQPSDAAVS
jgi:DNA repair protein RadA/Sms